MKIILLVNYILTLINFVQPWNLNSLRYLNNFTVRHVTINCMRAYLCIESLDRGNSSVRPPTLIEATWPENFLPIRPKAFPTIDDHDTLTGSNGDCNKIQNALCTNLDRKSQLWMLDGGSSVCKPKIVIYMIVPWSGEIYRENIKFLSNRTKLSSMLCDLNYSDDNSLRAFISLYDCDYLLVYYLHQRKFYKIKFQEYNALKNRNFFPTEMAWRNRNQMYLSNYKSDELYLLDISKITPGKRNNTKIPIKYIGRLLGPGNSLVTDSIGNLYYILSRDNAIVRWNGKRPLRAEKHEVLFQISKNIVQIIFGIRGSLWIVTATANEFIQSNVHDHCIRVLEHYTQHPTEFNENTSSSNNCNLYI